MKKRRNKKNRPPQPQQAQATAKPQQSGTDMLEAVEQRVEGQLMPEVRESYLKIVVAGMHAGLTSGPNGVLASLRNSKDPIADCAKGAVSMIFILRKQAKGVMPVKAMIPAGMTLMLKALDFAQKAGIVDVGPDELSRAAHIFMNTFLQAFGVTQQMLSHAVTRIHGIVQDPIAMEQIKRASGVVKHPDASEPNPDAEVA